MAGNSVLTDGVGDSELRVFLGLSLACELVDSLWKHFMLHRISACAHVQKQQQMRSHVYAHDDLSCIFSCSDMACPITRAHGSSTHVSHGQSSLYKA